MTTAEGRHSIRLKAYDYAWTGSYFVTLCVQGRGWLLGEVVAGACVLSEAGLMVESWWNSIPGRFPTVSLDAYVVMPNHFHGLLLFGWDSGAHDRTGRPPCLPSSSIAVPEMTNGESKHEPPALDADAAGIGKGRHGGLPVRYSETGGWPVDAEPPTLGRVIQWFKSASTHDYGIGVRDYGWAPYEKRLWLRNYYEHVVRDERDLDRIRTYIDGNPGRWTEDEHYRQWTAR